MAKIRQSSLDNSVITGQTDLNAVPADTDIFLVYDQSSGGLKRVTRAKLLGTPAFTSVSPSNATSGDGTGNYTFTIAGTDMTSSASLKNDSGSAINFDTVTLNSSTQITGVIAKSSLPAAGEPYDIVLTNANGTTATAANVINIDAAPAYNTAAGSLGSIADGNRSNVSITVDADDPESVGNVTYELQSGSLPAGLSGASVAVDGGVFRITGTANAQSSNTTSNFVLRAVDAASNTTSRAFAITVLAPVQSSFTSSGSFAVPAGVTAVTVLVVAGGGGGGNGGGTGGGGGGAGGLVYMPAAPVTPGGTITVTVGAAGPFAANGQDSAFGSPGDPGLGQGGVLTAKGGGGENASPGGSGAGGGAPNTAAGTATQPTQPGNSGAYGFGFQGGGGSQSGGGGGGAGGAGTNAHPSNHGGGGGVGKAYTIADGTTPVGYAGGGSGGGGNSPLGGTTVTPFGGGVGNAPQNPTIAGAGNKGGGGGGAGAGGAGTGGGKGIVVVAY